MGPSKLSMQFRPGRDKTLRLWLAHDGWGGGRDVFSGVSLPNKGPQSHPCCGSSLFIEKCRSVDSWRLLNEILSCMREDRAFARRGRSFRALFIRYNTSSMQSSSSSRRQSFYTHFPGSESSSASSRSRVVENRKHHQPR